MSCSPIAPGSNLTYEYVVAQHGSYWIHSHFMVCLTLKNSFSYNESNILIL
jgi:FtsP/CotA-like multicopper oxidase with cupredoxin domain